MHEKLAAIAEKYEAITEKLQTPDVYSDPARYARLSREQKELAPVAEAYRSLLRFRAEMESARALADDPELRELAREEYDAARAGAERLEAELKTLLLPRDPDDDRSVIIEIRGGAGGEEAALFAHSLFRMYTMYAESRRWKVDVANINETELGGIKEISFIVEGKGVYGRLKFESGVHRVQRVPDTESSGRIHTSTVTVAVLPERDEADFAINPADLQIDTFRSSGAGGQHVNKTESAIRVTHLPTGTVVECQDERSQRQNRERAMKILVSRLYEEDRRRRTAEVAAERLRQVGTGDRSERIRTYNYPQNRITDHRISTNFSKFDQILNGAIDEIIDALTMADRAAKLEAAGAE
ncbi:MAG: peptide chain release factor 1 [Oscillospiraceae bacterium]|jgi:peptide chain release factor 1|nr:peptide chain release factor 1 [Oscillospiraceae bacterium]